MPVDVFVPESARFPFGSLYGECILSGILDNLGSGTGEKGRFGFLEMIVGGGSMI